MWLQRHTKMSHFVMFGLLLTIAATIITKVESKFDPQLTKLANNAIKRAFEEENNVRERVSARARSCPAHQAVPEIVRRHHANLPPEKRTLDNAPLARLIIRATAELSKMTGLTPHQLTERVDTTATDLLNMCPRFAMPSAADCTGNTTWRTVDGRCNNVAHPLWGSAGSAFGRLVPARYPDGINAPITLAKSGRPLPLARAVSLCVSPTIIRPHRSMSITFVFMGQTIDHDLGLAPMARIQDPVRGAIPPVCCFVSDECKHPECLEFPVPPYDPVYSVFNRTCIEFVRTVPALRETCGLGVREQTNEPTHYLDNSFTYGSTYEREQQIRLFQRGLLKTSTSPSALNNGEEIPPAVPDNFECFERPPDRHCFNAGDERINENIELTSQHILWLREHNRVARFLLAYAQANGRSTLDNDIFQSARRIVIAQYEFAVFNEFLRPLLGQSVFDQVDLELELCLPGVVRPYCQDGFYTGYDPTLQNTVLHEFSTSAFRMGHTFLPEFLFRHNFTTGINKVEKLSDNFFNPFSLFDKLGLETIIHGALIKNVEAYDSTIVSSVRDDVYKGRTDLVAHGLDLFALNLARAREHAIGSYNDMREKCGFGRAKTWDDLLDLMDQDAIARLRCAYEDVDDVELFSGGVSERPINNDDGLIGPTKACIIAQQFRLLKKADRFWHERPGVFTALQLTEIRKFSMARLYCSNTKLTKVQPKGLVEPIPALNYQRNCSEILAPDLNILARLLPLAANVFERPVQTLFGRCVLHIGVCSSRLETT